MRRLVWKTENSLFGWGCTDCGFLLPNPKFFEGESIEEYAAGSRAKFDAHNCKEYPRRREDFSQAAARIVREATEG